MVPPFRVFYEERKRNRVLTIEFAILENISFPRNLTEINMGLLQIQEQIEQGDMFVPTVLDDKIRA